MTAFIIPVIEGHTERDCIERLLHRTWSELLGRPERLQVLEPFRQPRSQLVHPNGVVLVSSVSAALMRVQAKAAKVPNSRHLVLVLIDAERECPKSLAPRLLTTAAAGLPAGSALSCVLPTWMLENWFVAGASTLAGVNGMPGPIPPRDQFEERSGVAWLEAQYRKANRAWKYKKTKFAAEFARMMNLVECRQNSPSFDKLCRELEARLVPTAAAPDPPVSPPPPAVPPSA
jgi:hypothetical protein